MPDLPWHVARYRDFWHLPPIPVVAVFFVLGLVPALYAMGSPLGRANLLVDESRVIEVDWSEVESGEAMPPRQIDGTTYREIPRREPLVCRPAGMAAAPGPPECVDAVVRDHLFISIRDRRDGSWRQFVFRIKQVGYVYALNWSVNLMLAIPFVLYFAFRSLHGSRELIETLERHHMLCDDGYGAPVGFPAAATATFWRRAFVFGSAAFVIGVAVVVADCLQVVAGPLLAEQLGVGPGEVHFAHELDWSVSALFAKGYEDFYATVYNPQLVTDVFDKIRGSQSTGYLLALPGLLENKIFSFYVYALLAVATGVILAYYATIFCFAWTIEGVKDNRFGFRLVPYFGSDDRRAGFEAFSTTLAPLMIGTFVAYFMLYLMRTQNLFLRDHSYSTIFQYLLDDLIGPIKSIGAGLKTLVTDWSAGDLIGSVLDELAPVQDLANLLDPGLNDPQAYLSIFVLTIVFVLITFVFIASLRDLASATRDRLLLILSQRDAAERKAVIDYYGRYHELTAETREELAEEQWRDLSEDQRREAVAGKLKGQLQAMTVWPVRWPGLQALLRMLGLGILFMIFYRFWMLWLGVLLWKLINGKFKLDTTGP